MEKEENVEWSSADKEAIISHMSKAIKDNSLTLSRKDKQVLQADDCLTQIALVSWLTSPSGYKREQASSVEIYPSERTMYREYARLRTSRWKLIACLGGPFPTFTEHLWMN
jgi:hypothetical protein